jgi:hypothetical protein
MRKILPTFTVIPSSWTVRPMNDITRNTFLACAFGSHLRNFVTPQIIIGAIFASFLEEWYSSKVEIRIVLLGPQEEILNLHEILH